MSLRTKHLELKPRFLSILKQVNIDAFEKILQSYIQNPDQAR